MPPSPRPSPSQGEGAIFERLGAVDVARRDAGVPGSIAPAGVLRTMAMAGFGALGLEDARGYQDEDEDAEADAVVDEGVEGVGAEEAQEEGNGCVADDAGRD